MALALRLLLLLLLAVALPARAAQAAPLQARRADWNSDMGFQEVLMKDGLKFLEDAGAEPAGEGPTSRTEALGDAEGRRFIRTLVVIANKTSLHGRVPPKRKMQDTTEKISLEPSKQMRQVLKKMLQGGKEMKGEPVQMEAFPGGSSGSVPTSVEGREATPGTGTGDEVAGKASPLPWMNKVLKPLEPPADVSPGRTSPAPTLDAAHKSSSHGRGSPTGKILNTTDKISLEPSKLMRKELKEALQTREEMDIVLQWKVAFLEGSTPSSVPAPAAGRKAMPDTGTGTADWDAGTVPPLAWRSEVVKPSEHSAGVSAGTTSPTPTLDAAQKASSHGRGPPTGETKDMAGKKFQDPLEVMWQMLKECLQRRQEMKGEPVQKEAFPGGSSGSVPASAEGREAMPGTGTGAEPAGEGPTSRTEALGDAEGVSAGRTSPAPALDAQPQPSSHGRGSPTGKIQDRTDQISLEPPKQTKQELKEMRQGGQEMKGEPVHMEALPRGSSGSMPASAPRREAMPDPGMGDEVAGKASPLAWMNKVSKPLEPPADVSTGRTSPAPNLEAAQKPISHQSVTPTGKIQDTTDKISLEPSKQMRQELKELLQTRQEMDIVLQWKVAFLEGSTPSSVPASAAGKKAMPDTGTGTADWEAGKDSPLAWRYEVLKPSGHSAGVSAGTTSPTPTLDDTEKPSSHGRGPMTGETKDMAGKKFQDPLEIMWQMLKERLQRKQEMKGEPVHMEALPRGSSGSVPASAAGRETVQGTGTGAEPAGEGPTSRTEALGDAEGVSAGRTSSAPGLDAWPQPSSHGRGPPKGKTQDTAAKKSHEADEFLRETQKEAPGGQVMDQKAVQKEEQPGRSSGSLAALAAGRKAMTDTGTGTADAAGTTRPVPNAQDGLRRGFCQGTGCWLLLLASVLCLGLVFLLYCFGIGYSWKRKQSTSGQELEDGGCTSHPDSVSSSSSSRNGLDSPLKCSVKRTPEQPTTRKPLIAP
ncbi:uncharacterized protein LOC135303977 isoform X3 [Passer domesticus]|uniref:uncharacterized protein LOC135303977 isoform X3 n=1 Tax=Passer domesticus TaxID=48849 RepID=UPI0030FED2F0